MSDFVTFVFLHDGPLVVCALVFLVSTDSLCADAAEFFQKQTPEKYVPCSI
jgi:hypothetical protein